jgi:hypothetical protein
MQIKKQAASDVKNRISGTVDRISPSLEAAT